MMDTSRKVLVLTRNAWNNNNCTGNTLSNFFNGWSQDCIANAFFRAESIDNPVCTKYFRVTEQELVRNIKNPSLGVGEAFTYHSVATSEVMRCVASDEDEKSSKVLYGFFARHRLTVALWVRDMLWAVGRWKNQCFDEFLKEFSPDIIYMPCYDSVYMHRILWYVAKKTHARIVLFTGDDTYTLKQFSLSPLFWINRFINRAVMRKSVAMSDTLFVISDKQKEEYDKIFRRNCVLLRKGGDFSAAFQPKAEWNHPLRIVYTGNIHSGRWKTIAKIVESLRRLNAEGSKIQMDIYTLSARNDAMVKALTCDGTSRIMPPASNEEIGEALHQADILLFVEPFELQEKLKWRLSFSTKIVDYLASSRAILAVGPRGLASMDYLQTNDAALCVNSPEAVEDMLKKVVEDQGMLLQYAEKAWKCGERNNDIACMREVFMNEIEKNED